MSENRHDDSLYETKLLRSTEQAIKNTARAEPVPLSGSEPVRHRRTDRYTQSESSYHTPVGVREEAPLSSLPEENASVSDAPIGYTPAAFTPAAVPSAGRTYPVPDSAAARREESSTVPVSDGTVRFSPEQLNHPSDTGSAMRYSRETLLPESDSGRVSQPGASVSPRISTLGREEHVHDHSVTPFSEEYDEEEFENDRSVSWLKITVCVLLCLILAGCAVRFLVPDDASGILGSLKGGMISVEKAIVNMILPEKEPAPEVTSLNCISGPAVAGQKIKCVVTTTASVDAVRLVYEDGTVLPFSDGVLQNAPDETYRTWLCEFSIPDVFTGSVYAQIYTRSGEWLITAKSVSLLVAEPTAVPTPVITPVPTPTSIPTNVPPGTVIFNSTSTPIPTQVPDSTPIPTPVPTQMPTAIPTATPSPEPTPVPTATPVPTPTPMPLLEAQAGEEADPALLKMTDTLFSGSKALNDFTRDESDRILAPAPDDYVVAKNGIFTFRGDNFRRNAAYGTVEISTGTMSVMWKTPLGSLNTKDSGVLYGVGWGTQPAIVKWPGEVRRLMGLYESAADTSALKEVIFPAQDGNVYFLDLLTGSETRDKFKIGYPLRGSVTVDPGSYPMIAFGQAISKLKTGATGSIGYHCYSLISNKSLFFINGRASDKQKQYSSNGAFDGTGLFLNSDTARTLVVAGENGLIYTVNLNAEFDYLDKKTLTLSPETLYLRSKASAEKEARTGIESSLAMYGRYIYVADGWGIVRCVDSDTMKTVWAVDTGDNTDASLALDFDEEGKLGLYTGNTAFDRLGKKSDVTLRRMDALTGSTLWTYNVSCAYNKSELSGCKASPLIGENSISDLVIFTVNMTGDGKTSTMLALDKMTGKLRWKKELSDTSISSPVAVYNQLGNAWIIQADESGKIHLLDGVTGSELSVLDLEGPIQSSPAVYQDVLVIGTCGKENSYMYGIRLE